MKRNWISFLVWVQPWNMVMNIIFCHWSISNCEELFMETTLMCQTTNSYQKAIEMCIYFFAIQNNTITYLPDTICININHASIQLHLLKDWQGDVSLVLRKFFPHMATKGLNRYSLILKFLWLLVQSQPLDIYCRYNFWFPVSTHGPHGTMLKNQHAWTVTHLMEKTESGPAAYNSHGHWVRNVQPCWNI